MHVLEAYKELENEAGIGITHTITSYIYIRSGELDKV